MTGSAPSQGLKTLDGYFSSHFAERGDKPALADPVNRQLFSSGAPRTLTFMEMDGAVSRLAAHFASLGLKPLDVVMVQLPNTIEMPITILALSRAGLIASPVPVAWGLHEVKKAGAAIRPRAIITCGYVGKQQLADRMRFAAFDTPSVRFVFSYGIDLPDGVIPL